MKATIICDSIVFKPLKKETKVELKCQGKVVGILTSPPTPAGSELAIEGLSFEFKLAFGE